MTTYLLLCGLAWCGAAVRSWRKQQCYGGVIVASYKSAVSTVFHALDGYAVAQTLTSGVLSAHVALAACNTLADNACLVLISLKMVRGTRLAARKHLVWICTGFSVGSVACALSAPYFIPQNSVMHPVYLAVTPLLNTLALSYFVLVNAYHTRVLVCAPPAHNSRSCRLAAQFAIVSAVFAERWSVYAQCTQATVYLFHCLRSTVVLFTFWWVVAPLPVAPEAEASPRELTLIF